VRGTSPAKGTYRPGIGRTSIIQEVSAAAPLRIPCDVFNRESAREREREREREGGYFND